MNLIFEPDLTALVLVKNKFNKNLKEFSIQLIDFI